jgi:hypothetical protein
MLLFPVVILFVLLCGFINVPVCLFKIIPRFLVRPAFFLHIVHETVDGILLCESEQLCRINMLTLYHAFWIWNHQLLEVVYLVAFKIIALFDA